MSTFGKALIGVNVALAIAFVPRLLVWVIAAFTLVNGLFLAVSIAAAARASGRPATVPAQR